MRLLIEAWAASFQIVSILEVAAAVQAVDVHGAQVSQQGHEPTRTMLRIVKLISLQQLVPGRLCPLERSHLQLLLVGQLPELRRPEVALRQVFCLVQLFTRAFRTQHLLAEFPMLELSIGTGQVLRFQCSFDLLAISKAPFKLIPRTCIPPSLSSSSSPRSTAASTRFCRAMRFPLWSISEVLSLGLPRIESIKSLRNALECFLRTVCAALVWVHPQSQLFVPCFDDRGLACHLRQTQRCEKAAGFQDLHQSGQYRLGRPTTLPSRRVAHDMGAR
mmetsp:Transcript_141221/g.244524  ORF Transcript_141221/g.244524 Transcript_141221/m.244524 type:complete len:275 (-) Transcript_141221:68-892(-)